VPMRSIEQVLAEIKTFEGLEQRHLDRIAGCGQNTGFASGEQIAREGDRADTFYVIRHGRVALETPAPGGGPLLITTLGDGTVVGWSWLFAPYRWEFDARAVEDTRAIAFDGACLRGKCEEDHELGYVLMQRFVQIILDRLQATRLQLLDVYGNPAVR
jgi:CRP/FNR family cyclic AMP-dependent transcriptional regulator